MIAIITNPFEIVELAKLFVGICDVHGETAMLTTSVIIGTFNCLFTFL